MMTLLLVFFIGFFGGLRALTAPAATAWAVYLGWLKLDGWLALIGSLSAVVIFTVLAIVELVADKLPRTPNRTAPPGLIARIVMGGLTGACIAAGGSARSFSWRTARRRRRHRRLFPGLPGAHADSCKRWARGTFTSHWLRISWRSPAACGWFRGSRFGVNLHHRR